MTENTDLKISARRLARYLFTVVACLFVIQMVMWFFDHALGHDYVLGLVRLFRLGSEDNVPTWVSALLLLLASLLIALVALQHKTHKLPMRLRWKFLAGIFLFLSIDEAGAIHDLVYLNLAQRFGSPEGLFHYTWVIPYGILCVFFLVAYLPLLAYLPARTRRLFVVAGLVYVGAALGLEMTAAAVMG